jgi:hypothetical protein
LEAAFLDKGAASLYESETRLGKIFTAFAFLAGFISLFAAALPIVYQSLKAAVADPVKALRYE